MKNIQLIEPAQNCEYALFSCSDAHFDLLFPGKDQDIEFVDDAVTRMGESQTSEVFKSLYANPISKKTAAGIHGTLFLDMDYKKQFYPNKKEIDLTPPSPLRGSTPLPD